MNSRIKLQQDTSVGYQLLVVDTSTDYKTFEITEFDHNDEITEEFTMQLQMREGELVLNNVQLNKLGIKLLKEFINQLNTEL